MKISALKAQSLPSPREEKWKYTNLPRAVPDGLTPQPEDVKTIHAAKGKIIAAPENVSWHGESGKLHYPRLVVTAEDQTELTIIERHDGTGAYWKNMTTEINVGQGSRVNHIRIQNDSHDAVHTNMMRVNIARDACYNTFSLNVGSKLSRHEIHAVIEGPGSECLLNGINLFGGTQHGDTTILIEHTAPHCHSSQFYRTLLNDTARGVFQGKIHVHKPAQKTDGYQLSNAILLSPKAEMDTKPELEIYADDVKCSHGSTTGPLDETPLFYLRSRGLPEKEARLLLIRAFTGEVLEKIGDEGMRAELTDIVDEWLKKSI